MVRTLLWARNREYLPMDLEHKKRRYQLGRQAGMCRIIHDWVFSWYENQCGTLCDVFGD
jgi:hypothetical protein